MLIVAGTALGSPPERFARLAQFSGFACRDVLALGAGGLLVLVRDRIELGLELGNRAPDALR